MPPPRSVDLTYPRISTTRRLGACRLASSHSVETRLSGRFEPDGTAIYVLLWDLEVQNRSHFRPHFHPLTMGGLTAIRTKAYHPDIVQRFTTRWTSVRCGDSSTVMQRFDVHSITGLVLIS